MAAGMIPPPGRPERRKTPRISEQVSLSLAHADGVIRADTQNLSTAGAYCVLDRFIPPLTKLELELNVPDGRHVRSIRCLGVVVRVEPVLTSPQRGRYQTAVLFTELSERDRSAIARFVTQRLSNSVST